MEDHQKGVETRPCPLCKETGRDGWHATSWDNHTHSRRKKTWAKMVEGPSKDSRYLVMRKLPTGAELPYDYDF